MTGKKNPQDENLIKQLHEKLDWYTCQDDDQFNAQEVDAILKLLDVLEPLEDDSFFSADNAWKRFEERYDLRSAGEEEPIDPECGAAAEAAAAGIDAGPNNADGVNDEGHTGKGKIGRLASVRRGPHGRHIFVRLAVGAVACVVLVVSLNVGTYAVAKKSFFEVVTDSLGGRKVTVTGNMDEQENEVISYQSWEELEADVGEKFLKPGYLPEGYELGEITCKKFSLSKLIVANYYNGNQLICIKISVYENIYSKRAVINNEEWNFIMEENDIEYYSRDEYIDAVFIKDNYIYSIYTSESLDVTKDIVNNIK